jgi:hypothetical protein
VTTWDVRHSVNATRLPRGDSLAYIAPRLVINAHEGTPKAAPSKIVSIPRSKGSHPLCVNGDAAALGTTAIAGFRFPSVKETRAGEEEEEGRGGKSVR